MAALGRILLLENNIKKVLICQGEKLDRYSGDSNYEDLCSAREGFVESVSAWERGFSYGWEMIGRLRASGGGRCWIRHGGGSRRRSPGAGGSDRNPDVSCFNDARRFDRGCVDAGRSEPRPYRETIKMRRGIFRWRGAEKTWDSRSARFALCLITIRSCG
jgi:hypothetical protein